MKPMNIIQLLAGVRDSFSRRNTLDLVTSLVHLPGRTPTGPPSLERRHHGCAGPAPVGGRPGYARSITKATLSSCGPMLARSFRPSGLSWAWPGESAKVRPFTASAATRCRILVVHPPWGLSDGLGAGFFSSPRAVGMDLDDGAVQRHRLQLDTDQLGALQVFEDPVLGPTIHTGVDRVPVPKALRQPSPLAPLLGDVQDRVEHLQIGHADIATLSREAGLDACVLRLVSSIQQ